MLEFWVANFLRAEGFLGKNDRNEAILFNINIRFTLFITYIFKI